MDGRVGSARHPWPTYTLEDATPGPAGQRTVQKYAPQLTYRYASFFSRDPVAVALVVTARPGLSPVITSGDPARFASLVECAVKKVARWPVEETLSFTIRFAPP